MKNRRTYNPPLISLNALIAAVIPGMVSIILSCNPDPDYNRKLSFVVNVPVSDSSDHTYFVLDWETIEQHLGPVGLRQTELRIRDLNNDAIICPEVIDSNNDNVPDCVKVQTQVGSEEPLRPFELLVNRKRKSALAVKNEDELPQDGLSIEYLRQPDSRLLVTNYNNRWTYAVSETFVTTYPEPFQLEIFAPAEWTYTTGFFLNGLCYYDELSGTEKYLSYVQGWLDSFVSEGGCFDTLKYDKTKYRLDDVLPGRSLLYVYEKTGNEKYLKAAGELLNQLKHQPRTSERGYWHKKIYEWQMWLDGIYMSDVFLLQYASLVNMPEYYDDAVYQFKLIHEHTLDTATGLLYHGWDESRRAIWADPLTGRSPEFWGRGMGWYMMALVDALDYIPLSHPGRNDILGILEQLSASVVKYQDAESGLWYQVIDKADRKGNWPETSCTAMFAYSFLKAYKKGYLPVSYKESAQKAYEGLKRDFIFFDDSGKLYLTGTVKVGTLNVEVSNGSYDYYISVDRRVNDFKGIGALLYLAIADEYLKPVNPEADGL